MHKKQSRQEGLKRGKFTKAFHSSLYAILITRPSDGSILYVNRGFEEIFGYPSSEVIGKTILDLHLWLKDSDCQQVFAELSTKGEVQSKEFQFRKNSGGGLTGLFFAEILDIGNERFVLFSINDITERKQADQTILSLARFSIENPNPVLRIGRDGNLYYANEAAFTLLAEWKLEPGKLVPECLKSPTYEVFETQTTKTIEISCGENTFSIVIAPAAEDEYVNLYGHNITERKLAEEALLENKSLLQQVIDNTSSLIYLLDKDGRFLLVNAGLAANLGESADQIRGKERKGFLPKEIAQEHQENDLKVMKTGKSFAFEEESRERDGKHVYYSVKFPVTDSNGHFYAIGGISVDITERKRAEDELRRTVDELKHSNAELEQFAYVASHDLQEPLRMVTSYVQLLERRYKGKLDNDADEFIGFAVEGVERMQKLINDLLAFSRLETRARSFAPTSCDAALAQALDNLQVAIRESKAKITYDPLPEVVADGTQLIQLFQNLVGNAVKFHGDKAPRVRISVDEHEKEWVFSVRDNGIGFDQKYAGQVFIIFHRLHDRSQFAGNGIGLAICKKIVQRHGGRIWVESQPGKGTSFYFTLPKTEGK